MNKTFLLFPLRFENIIYIISSYVIALILKILFEDAAISIFVFELLKFTYPMASIVIAILFLYIIGTEKNKIKNIVIPFLPLVFSWGIIYYLLYIIL